MTIRSCSWIGFLDVLFSIFCFRELLKNGTIGSSKASSTKTAKHEQIGNFNGSDSASSTLCSSEPLKATENDALARVLAVELPPILLLCS